MSQVAGSVDARFDPRHNSVNALRLGLALLVLVSHTLKLAGGTDPLGELTGGPSTWARLPSTGSLR